MSRPIGEVAPRFWAKVEKTETCWLWGAAQNNRGYGQIRVAGRLVLAHRWSYEATVGPIPDGLHLDHLCRVRNCVNPDHLEPVTNRENSERGSSFTAINARKTSCPQGHSYSSRGDGARYCRTCNAARVARYKARKKASA